MQDKLHRRVVKRVSVEKPFHLLSFTVVSGASLKNPTEHSLSYNALFGSGNLSIRVILPVNGLNTINDLTSFITKVSFIRRPIFTDFMALSFVRFKII